MFEIKSNRINNETDFLREPVFRLAEVLLLNLVFWFIALN